MSRFMVLVAPIFLASCNSELSSSPDKAGVSNDSIAAHSSVGNEAAATMSLLGTTWEFNDDGAPTVVTIDQAGGYIEEHADGTHVVHGTYEQRDSKDCFTGLQYPALKSAKQRLRRMIRAIVPSSEGSLTGS